VTDPTEQPEGIIAVLKKVSADFAKMEAQTKAQEESDQSLFDEDMKRCSIEKAGLVKESEMKGTEKKRLIEKTAQMLATPKRVSDEHAAVVQYLKDLEHGCVDGDSTYEDRKAARAKERSIGKSANHLARRFQRCGETQRGENNVIRGKSKEKMGANSSDDLCWKLNCMLSLLRQSTPCKN